MIFERRNSEGITLKNCPSYEVIFLGHTPRRRVSNASRNATLSRKRVIHPPAIFKSESSHLPGGKLARATPAPPTLSSAPENSAIYSGPPPRRPHTAGEFMGKAFRGVSGQDKFSKKIDAGAGGGIILRETFRFYRHLKKGFHEDKHKDGRRGNMRADVRRKGVKGIAARGGLRHG